MRKKIIILVIAIIIFIVAIIFSITKFKVINPISSCFGMLQILFSDKECTVVQNFPYKVILSKEGRNLLDEYMQNRGFVLKEQMGSIYTYSNGEKEEHIWCTGNSYYSKWIWK